MSHHNRLLGINGRYCPRRDHQHINNQHQYPQHHNNHHHSQDAGDGHSNSQINSMLNQHMAMAMMINYGNPAAIAAAMQAINGSSPYTSSRGGLQMNSHQQPIYSSIGHQHYSQVSLFYYSRDYRCLRVLNDTL